MANFCFLAVPQKRRMKASFVRSFENSTQNGLCTAEMLLTLDSLT